MGPLVISLAAFVGAAALVGGVAVMIRERTGGRFDERLSAFTTSGRRDEKDRLAKDRSLMAALETAPGVFEQVLQRFGRLGLLFEQAESPITPTSFFAISGGLAALGLFVLLVTGSHPLLALVVGLLMSLLPLGWLIMRRRARLKKFGSQLPDALDLIARALRAGHSLASGFHLVQEEMPAPISTEFGRVFEEQNLGIAMEDAMRNMTDRVPNLDLKFFVTAVVLQRQTGGDLAEILDKIGNLIRERFKIWGQVQALTGEGRLSGVVLLALPPVLFLVMLKLNKDYVMTLFTDPMGKKMLAGAIVLQLFGALVIKKIVTIKV